MKFFVVFALAVLACVNADCGCLKGRVHHHEHHESHHSQASCSKHLSVAGEINGAPGYKPIKVIYRCQNGQGSCPHFPSALPIEIQKPVSIPDVPISCGGHQYSYGMQAFYNNPSLVSNYQGTYDNSHQGFSHGLTHGNNHGYQETLADGLGIHPITVQKPVELPQNLPNCIPMKGLQAAIDRVVLPSNPNPGFRHLIDSADRYNPVYRHCPELLRQRERHSCKSSCPCAPGPIIQLLHGDRYENLASRVTEKSKQEYAQCVTRKKRHLPFLDHGYKFVMNMLPPFIQDPIKNTVNIMALTHPDKKLQKMYNQPPKQTLHEKLLEQHKKNVANLKELLVPTLKKHPKKYASDDHFLRKEASDFLDSLQEHQTKFKKSRIPGLRMRTPSYNENEEMKSDDRNRWLREMIVHDILDNDMQSNLISSEETKGNFHMTEAEKLLFKLKLKKLNGHRSKRETPLRDDSNQLPDNCRKKRSFIIDSEELSLPLYQVTLGQSKEESEESKEEFEESEESEEDYYQSRERVVGKLRRKMYDDDEDYFEPRKTFGGHRRKSDDASKERLMRKAIREELRKFKREESGEAIVASPSPPNIMFPQSPQSPLVHLLSLPMKLFSGLNNFNKQAVPIVGSVPKIIVGTKKYFRDFGRNFKKNALHFASDVIGDFDHTGPSDNILGAIFNQRRHKRSLNKSHIEIGLPRLLRNVPKRDTMEFETLYSLGPINNSNTQTFHSISNFDSKVRKKRYILKMVDDDEVEAILRKKLEKLFDESEESYRPQKRRHRMHKYSDETYSGEVLQSKRFARRRKYDDSEEDHNRNVVVQKVRPKVIIDNNGLTFMELDGYRRPMFMKNKKIKKKKLHESSEDHGLTNYDSSEEANLQKIHGVIDIARNCQSTRNTEMPLQTLKEKISQLLFETDALVHMDFDKYDEIYDNLINIQQIKTSTVQDWKRLIMEKRINDHDAKISLLGKFHEMQRIKEMAVQNVVYALYLDNDNKFVLKEFSKVLIRLQKLQCIMNQVVGCFQQKFTMGTKFELDKEIKYVDYLASTNFVYAKTRNDLIAKLREARDCQLQANIQQLEKLKKMLVENDERIIEEESNILWEMKNIEKMQTANIEEMYHNLEEGCKIKKNLKIFFDFSKRLDALEMEEKKMHLKCESQESDEDVEVSIEDKKSIKIETSSKKFDIDEFKKKWHDKLKKKKFLMEKNLKKTLIKLKLKNGSNESNESE